MLNIHYPLIAEWLCFLVSILLLNNADRYWHTLRFYLGVVVLTESIAYYMVAVAKCPSNQWVYNLSILIEYGYGIWMLANLIQQKHIKYVALLFYLLFYGSYIFVYIGHKYSIESFFNISDTIGSELMIVLCMVYYYTLFHDEKYVKLLEEPLFWFITGYFIFYTTSVGADTFFQKLVSTTKIHSVSIRYLILKFLNPVLYACWIRTFICIKNKRKLSQQ